ncbi:polysaccharide biosynthesis tyrosine autokinase [Thalassotalea litorea]|uniref:polysaccharide biosynthesis tyrosine autokinase n=1 Tax=Thalassotalea litorea TaxID=2020715 RepID=UPI003735BD08
MNESPHIQKNEPEQGLDWAKLISTFWDGRLIILATSCIFFIFSIVLSFTLPPIFKANVLLQIEEKSGAIPGLNDVSELFSSEGSADTEIQIIKSRFVLGETIKSLGLDLKVTPDYFPVLGRYNANYYTLNTLAEPMFASGFAWGGEKLEFDIFNVGDSLLGKEFTFIIMDDEYYVIELDGEFILKGKVGELSSNEEFEVSVLVSSIRARKNNSFTVVKYSFMETFLKLKDELSINEQGKNTGIINITLLGENKSNITKTLESISNTYFSQNVQRMAAEAENSLSFLDQQLPKVIEELNRSEEALNRYKLERDSVDLTFETQSLLEKLVDLESQINEMVISEQDLSRRYTPQHPNYISFQKQQKGLVQERNRILEKTSGLPETQQIIIRLMRDFEVNQQIYLALQNKAQELAIIKASTVGNVRILDQAEVFPIPESPKKPLIILSLTFLGFLLGVFVAYIRALFNRGVLDSEDFENVGLSVYANIPASEKQRRFNQKLKEKLKFSKAKKVQEKAFLLSTDSPEDLTVEAIRSLRTSLHFALLESKNNIITISGASPNVGKSFVASNLATVLAQSGKRVLLIDADLRKGYIQKVFGLHWDNGLSELLLGQLDEKSAIKATAVEGLDLVTRGVIPPNPSELLMSEKFSTFLESVSKNYDLVIIDTPPILAVSDPIIVAKQSSTTLLVAKYNFSPIKEVMVATNRFEANGVNVKGIIFNGVEKRAASGLVGNYSYAYSYGVNAN